ncbi:MAG TPA: MGMT family protein [Acidobacteriota bacterium]|nr:MGMT family protein [Acidobacteriota bacterium]
MHYYGDVETEIGKLRVGYGPDGITMINLAGGPAAAFEKAYARLCGVRPQPGKIPDRFRQAVQKAAAGKTFAPVPIDLSGVSKFQLKVLKELQKVPRGEVRTYSWLARKVGRPLAARAVGNTMARNPVPFLVPCHRVVPASGGVGNFGFGKSRKRELLEREGVPAERLE